MGTYPKIPEVDTFSISDVAEALREKYAAKDDAFAAFVTRLSTEMTLEGEQTLMAMTYLWRRGEIVFQPKQFIMGGLFEGEKTPCLKWSRVLLIV